MSQPTTHLLSFSTPPDISLAGLPTVKSKKITYAYVPAFVTICDALVPMARRSGLDAVARAYDAGLSVPVLTDAVTDA